MPSNDLQQAKADMFAEGVYGLENEIVRAIVHADPAQQVLYKSTKSTLKFLYSKWINIANQKK